MIPNRAFVATATGTFADINGNVGPTVVAGWHISETGGAAAAATLTDGYFTTPSTLVAALVATSTGVVDAGTHSYKLTYVTAQGETEANTASNVVTTDSTHKQVTVSSIPAPPEGVTSRNLYRTAAGGSTYKLLATLLDPTVTTYTDNKTDAQLGGNAPSSNTTGYVIAGWTLASGGRDGLANVNFAARYPGAPLRYTLASGAARCVLFGR